MTTPTGSQPTQVKHPLRAVARTVFGALIGAAIILPEVVHEMGWDGAAWLSIPLAVGGGITRLLAIPAVNEWLRQYVPFLAAKP